MWQTVIAIFLSLCKFISAESFETFAISQDSSFINITQINIELGNDKYNTDVNLNTLQMIRKAGYPAEAHIALTEDGYLLTLHRIPGSKNSPPVLLQHGLLCSSADWVILGRGKALAYILADQGYDIWLGNFRGNTYSRAHISLSPSSSNAQFWDFSFHEMGIYDLPAMITYITNITAQPLHTYIGHSMGTTAFYVMAVERPESAAMIGRMISLAPIAFVEHMKSPLHYLARFANYLGIIARFVGANEFLPQSTILRILAGYGCDADLFKEKICSNVLFLICGFDKEQFNYTLLPTILSHDPAGTSTKTMIHFLQEIRSGKFRQYDYGRKKNMQIYKAPQPPDYNLSNITTPIALFYADNDWLNNVIDVKRLYNSLTNVLDTYRVSFPKFNHIDFLWAKDAPTLVYDRLLQIMKR
ncbi:lipase 3 [Linepithema humile]|uniref:lipase 3 n=1 Tax=Linepithema humile TaxID=83485 RepID=UPI0006231B46|nr:PREDICTED: lipase 3-like [Linepithema humile]